jgi:hypothetical protein
MGSRRGWTYFLLGIGGVATLLGVQRLVAGDGGVPMLVLGIVLILLGLWTRPGELDRTIPRRPDRTDDQ